MTKIFKKIHYILFALLILLGISGIGTATASAATSSAISLTEGKSSTVELPSSFTITANEVLAAAKSRADYIRKNGFKYGDPKKNPALDDSERLIACDRYVQWVFYDLGFQDLPPNLGLVVGSVGKMFPDYDLMTWCKNHSFKKITKMTDLKAGDVVFLGVSSGTHVYILGKKQSDGLWQRYDFGDKSRMGNIQPTVEPVEYLPYNPFFCAYRIVSPKVTWTSSDKKIAKVTSAGKITALQAGTCKVTAKSSIASKTYTVTVKSAVPKVSSEKELSPEYTGSAVIGGKTYYVKNGKKYTGERTVGGKVYYYKKGLKYTGFLTVKTRKYYYSKGVLQTGFKKISGNYYYFYKAGTMKKSSWGNVSGKRYYFGKDGKTYKGWHKISGKYYYFDKKNSALQRSKWIGKWYVNQKGVRTKHK